LGELFTIHILTLLSTSALVFPLDLNPYISSFSLCPQQFATSFKMFLDNWNIQTALWLKRWMLQKRRTLNELVIFLKSQKQAFVVLSPQGVLWALPVQSHRGHISPFSHLAWTLPGVLPDLCHGHCCNNGCKGSKYSLHEMGCQSKDESQKNITKVLSDE